MKAKYLKNKNKNKNKNEKEKETYQQTLPLANT